MTVRWVSAAVGSAGRGLDESGTSEILECRDSKNAKIASQSLILNWTSLEKASKTAALFGRGIGETHIATWVDIAGKIDQFATLAQSGCPASPA
jgi:hypothetical protein